MSVARYRLAGREFAGDAPDLSGLLAAAHEKKARPRCLCAAAGPEMYVARFGDDFLLKRMPGTGHLHDPSCPTFDPPPELSGLGQVNGKAIVSDQEGATALKLDFPLSMRSGRAVSPADGKAAAASSATAAPNKLSLLGMLHYLWDTAELTKWRPSWAGKRGWWLIHRELTAVAERTSSKAGPLSSILLVPPQFHPDRKEALARDRRRFLHHLQPAKGKPVPLGLLVAELKSQEPSQYGRRLRFKHLPEMAFFMDEDLGRRFEKLTAAKAMMVEATEGAHMIAIATFSMRGNYAEIREIAVMPVTADWIPFDNDREMALVEALARRSFVKCLRYNLRPDAPVASALLTDTSPPTALYVPPHDLAPEAEAELREIAGEGAFPPWIWPAAEFEMPGLPVAGRG